MPKEKGKRLNPPYSVGDGGELMTITTRELVIVGAVGIICALVEFILLRKFNIK